MKQLIYLLTLFSSISNPGDKGTALDNLHRNWKFVRYEASTRKEITYNSSAEFGNYYGYQFKKNGSVTISRSVSNLPRENEPDFEEVDGKWLVTNDSILTLTYKSNNRIYKDDFVIRKLTSEELVLHPKK